MFTSANLHKKMTKNHLPGKLLTIPDCIYVTITFNYPNTSYQMDKKSIKGSKTEHNLLAAFAGESRHVHAIHCLPKRPRKRATVR